MGGTRTRAAHLACSELASRVPEEGELDPLHDGPSLARGRVACECRPQHRQVAAMGLELHELEARDHQMGIGVRRKRGEKRHRLTRERFRLVPTSGRGARLDGDRDRGIPVVRRSGDLLLRNVGRGPAAAREQENAQKQGR